MSTAPTEPNEAEEPAGPPPHAPPPSPEELTRREFLTKIGVGLAGLTALLVGAPVIGFLIAPLFRKPPEIWRSVGAIGDFTTGETVEVRFLEASPLPWSGVAAQTAAWLRKESEQEFIVFSVQCTHLGCPVSWLAGAKLFMCPCHGGVYYPDGRVAAGPPPNPLTRYPVRVRNGEVEVEVSAVPTSPQPGPPPQPPSGSVSSRP